MAQSSKKKVLVKTKDIKMRKRRDKLSKLAEPRPSAAKKRNNKSPGKRLTPQQREQKQKRIHAANMDRVGKYVTAYAKLAGEKIAAKAKLQLAQDSHKKAQRRLKSLLKKQKRLARDSTKVVQDIADAKDAAAAKKERRDKAFAKFKSASKGASAVFKKKRAAEQSMNKFITRYPHVLM